VIVSGSTDYLCYQAAALGQCFAIRFPGLTGARGRSAPSASPPDDAEDGHVDAPDDVEAEVAAGTVDAPPRSRR
jgi:hypothetical protein